MLTLWEILHERQILFEFSLLDTKVDPIPLASYISLSSDIKFLFLFEKVYRKGVGQIIQLPPSEGWVRHKSRHVWRSGEPNGVRQLTGGFMDVGYFHVTIKVDGSAEGVERVLVAFREMGFLFVFFNFHARGGTLNRFLCSLFIFEAGVPPCVCDWLSSSGTLWGAQISGDFTALGRFLFCGAGSKYL